MKHRKKKKFNKSNKIIFMNIKKLTVTEADGAVNESTYAVTTVVATLDDDSVVTLFPISPDVPTVIVPLDTPVKLVAKAA